MLWGDAMPPMKVFAMVRQDRTAKGSRSGQNIRVGDSLVRSAAAVRT
jgi:hypothetical protein